MGQPILPFIKTHSVKSLVITSVGLFSAASLVFVSGSQSEQRR